MTEIYKASVIVSTYERPDALRAVLAGLANQTRTDFEVIVVDDGSGILTKDAVEETRAFFGVRLVHALEVRYSTKTRFLHVRHYLQIAQIGVSTNRAPDQNQENGPI